MIVAMIQARMGSTRLPNKVLMDMCGEPVLMRVVQRLGYSQNIDKLVVVTSINKENDCLRAICKQKDIYCFSGSEDDVLDRFYQASTQLKLSEDDIIIRITADCPLIDPGVVDSVIDLYQAHECDYASNVNPPTFPDGLDCEVFSYNVLVKTCRDAKLQSEREHVTLHIRNNPHSFRAINYASQEDHSGLRWTLDEKEDYLFIERVFNHFINKKKRDMFYYQQILKLVMDDESLSTMNVAYTRNEGLIKSLENDEIAKNE